MPGVENMYLGVRHIVAIALRLARVEREIILAPDNQQARLLLAHPRLPLGIGIDIGAIIVEQIALNLRLPRLIQKSELVRPQIRIVAIDVRIVSDMACPRRLPRYKICAKRGFVRCATFPEIGPKAGRREGRTSGMKMPIRGVRE